MAIADYANERLNYEMTMRAHWNVNVGDSLCGYLNYVIIRH